MHVTWYGQSAYALRDGDTTVFVDPFDSAVFGASGRRWYPEIAGVDADVLLVTHEHADHNAVDVIGGDPVLLRSLAGTHESPIGPVVGVASEHDDAAGTQRGHNVLYAFDFGGLRVAHLGDLGQAALRPEQIAALGEVDLLFVPAGGGPVLDAPRAAGVVAAVAPRVVVPMHYRTQRIDFLDPVDPFVARFAHVRQLDAPAFETSDLDAGDGPLLLVPAAP
jgi:L-ascorbate metabolism protein UlaG (beta-lactamase superfamily)